MLLVIFTGFQIRDARICDANKRAGECQDFCVQGG